MMLKRILIYIILFSLLYSNKSMAQIFYAKTFVYKQTVYLRFVPASMESWNEIKNKGFKIEKVELSGKDTSDLKRIGFNLLTLTPLKPLAKNDTSWKSIIQHTEYGAFVYSGLYQIPVSKTEKDKSSSKAMWGLLMKQADLNIEAAKLMGLYYKDAAIQSNKYYLYKISIPETDGKIKHQTYILVDPKQSILLPEPILKPAEAGNKKVLLSFEAKTNETFYSGYIIERSKDSIHFYPVTKKPLIFITTEYEKNKTEITHRDSIPNNKENFYYRVKGLSYFGEYGPGSSIIKMKGKEPLGSYPYVDSVTLTEKETQMKIHFHFPKETNMNVLKGILISRSEQSKTNPKIITSNLLPPASHTFTDSSPLRTNYYKVLAVTLDNDTISSFELFGMLPDREPPSIPKDFKGYIDSTGLVHLSWGSNSEKDIQGYRIFRKNAMNEELIERTRRIVENNNYTDTVDIHTLTKYIYYSITAVDKAYNNSDYSTPIKLKRPDIIPPVPAVFTALYHNKKGIVLKWNNSTSDDVEFNELYRVSDLQTSPIKLKEWFGNDSCRQFFDTSCAPGNTYQYIIKTFDDSKNRSEAKSLFLVFEIGLRKPIQNITTKTDLEKRLIELNWQYSEKDLFSFVIYKAKEGEELRIYKTLDGNQYHFIDKQNYPGNVYIYKIKAVYNSGVESEISQDIKVIF